MKKNIVTVLWFIIVSKSNFNEKTNVIDPICFRVVSANCKSVKFSIGNKLLFTI